MLPALQVLKGYKEAKALKVLPVLLELKVILFQVTKEAKAFRVLPVLVELKAYKEMLVDQLVQP